MRTKQLEQKTQSDSDEACTLLGPSFTWVDRALFKMHRREQQLVAKIFVRAAVGCDIPCT